MSGLGSHSLDGMGLAGDPGSPIHTLDPRAKIVGLLTITVVAVTVSPAEWPVWAACALLLAVVARLARVPAAAIWRRARLILPLVLFVAAFLPFFRHGGAVYHLGPLTVSEAGLLVLVSVAAKASIGTVSAVLLGATTSYPAVLRGLESMHVPRLLTLIAAFMYRYLFVIVDEVRRMRAARDARGYRPRTMLGAGAVGRLAAALFLRSYTRGERVYLAMLARGYGGTMPQLDVLAFRRADAAFVVVLAVPVIVLRILAGAA